MDDPILQFLRTLPDASGVRSRVPQRRPQPTIGAARVGSEFTPNFTPRGHAQELNPQRGATAGDVLDALLPVRPAAKLGYESAQRLQSGDKGGAAVASLAALPMMLPGGTMERLLGRAAKLTASNLPKRYAILTAENAGGTAMSAEANAARNAEMAQEFEKRGYRVTPVQGRYQDNQTGHVLDENSFLVHGIGEREAKLMAKRYGQNGVITQNGYHDLVSGELFPSKGHNVTNTLPYTQLPNGQKFALDIDWGAPQKSSVNALPVPKGFNPEVQRITQGMVERSGGTSLPRVAAVDPDAAKHMASVYESLPKNDPAAKKSYDALNSEVAQQYKALQDQGYKFEFVNEDPYKSSKEMMDDVQKNRRLKVFATPSDNFHPYMTPEQNNQFRAVHDLLAHAGEGHQFGPKGEENAYRVHMSTLSPDAQRALATETRGQNSWVNYGPNAHLPAAERPFAEQKAALWPTNLLGDYKDMAPSQMAPEQIQQWRGITDYLRNQNAGAKTARPTDIFQTAPSARDPFIRPGLEGMEISNKPETVGQAAMRSADGRIFANTTHAEAFNDMMRAGAEFQGAPLPFDGFLTSRGRFVSRDEAEQLAAASGHLDKGAVAKRNANSNQSFSVHELLDQPVPKETIVGSTIKTPDGRVFKGKPTHAQLSNDMRDAGVSSDVIDNSEAGFETSTGRHVTREEAARIAGFDDGELDASYLTTYQKPSNFKSAVKAFNAGRGTPTRKPPQF